jgi:hypothetical protein
MPDSGDRALMKVSECRHESVEPLPPISYLLLSKNKNSEIKK